MQERAGAIGVRSGICGEAIDQGARRGRVGTGAFGFVQLREQRDDDHCAFSDEILARGFVIELEKLDGGEGAIALVATGGNGLG